jgi:hypothetical protein
MECRSMAREPQYPAAADVGSDEPKAGSGGAAAAASAQARDHAAAAGDKASEGKRGKHLATGAAIGIGSAAIVAALLYANRRTKGDRGGNG